MFLDPALGELGRETIRIRRKVFLDELRLKLPFRKFVSQEFFFWQHVEL